MENVISQRVTPLLKCMILFLFIFTAKVLTSRPQESQETRNSINQVKPAHYVRTFTKYHHRRTNLHDVKDYWPFVQDSKVMGKRSVEQSDDFDINNYWPEYNEKVEMNSIKSSNNIGSYWPFLKPHNNKKRSIEMSDSYAFAGQSRDIPNLSRYSTDSLEENIVGSDDKMISTGKHNIDTNNDLPKEIDDYKVKKAIVPTDAPTTEGPSINCLYKMYSVSMGVTPSYEDHQGADIVVENDTFNTGSITDSIINGEKVQIKRCSNARAACYTLWHRDSEDVVTVLGQGCWRSPHTDGSGCDLCTQVTERLPATKFCCCTTSYCNADFMSMKEVPIAIKAESTMDTSSNNANYNIVAAVIFVVVAILVKLVLLKKFYCKKPLDKDGLNDSIDADKGEVMGTGPDSLATGLLCVDNLTLIEHIGQGKFGSVWRGALGSTPVAVKIFSNCNAWQKETAIYAMPHLAHPNILRYYGSESRGSLTSAPAREQLLVVELCAGSLQARLCAAPLTWTHFCTLAHGLAAAVAHLHTAVGNKPCIVHRDINSTNVLVSGAGAARLGDLGLATALPSHCAAQPPRVTEAGTLRYLAPEALEGALDLGGARAALCAVDVFALALVLWEMLWRTGAGAAPAYCRPYAHHNLPHAPTLAQMQNLVSRNKARPPLPKGPATEARALKLASDTCEECWDHDAEARLTAVCVEERMWELKHIIRASPRVTDNLHHHTTPDANIPSPPQEIDKNSNCTSTQNCDVTTPLLYPHPHIGRNACIERNTNTSTQQPVELIHKSLKDITQEVPRPQTVEENCLSVARINPHRIAVENANLNEIRSYQRPLDYVPNDVSSVDVERGPKETNLLQEVKIDKPKWSIKKFFERLNRKQETEVKLVPEVKTKSNVNIDRPTNLVLNQERYYEAPCTLSPPNRTLPANMMGDKFKQLPTRDNDPNAPSQIFAVIVPKAKPENLEMRSKTSRGSCESLNKSVRTSMSSQSILKSGHSESEDSTVKKRLSCDNRIITNSNSGRSSRASINLELQYINDQENFNVPVSPFDLNSDCSSSEDEHLMLLSENGGSKITMQTIPKEADKKKYQNEVLKESSQSKPDFGFNKFQNKYTNFDNEFSDPHDKENLVNGYSGDNPVYLAAINGDIDTSDLRFEEKSPNLKPSLKNLTIKRQHSLEQVSEIFSSSHDVNLLNPAGRVKTPGDLPVAVRRARRDRALQKGRASECNRLSLYDDRMMFGNSL